MLLRHFRATADGGKEGEFKWGSESEQAHDGEAMNHVTWMRRIPTVTL